jgi:hypothetical protein
VDLDPRRLTGEDSRLSTVSNLYFTDHLPE